MGGMHADAPRLSSRVGHASCGDGDRTHVNVHRDREGVFQTHAFERDQLDEPEVAEVLMQLCLWSQDAQHWENAGDRDRSCPSASAVSRLHQTLTGQYEAWRERPVLEHDRVVSLDGVHVTARHGEQADVTTLLTALVVD